MSNKMKIEVWSDIACPFCYIGKRKFETAISDLTYKNEIELEWKSFQLSPETVTDPTENIYEVFSKKKGFTVPQAKDMMRNVTQMASQVGLEFNFDKAVFANTFSAHQLLHFAKNHGKQNEAKEILLDGYFRQGKNVDDPEYLKSVIEQLQLDVAAFERVLAEKENEQQVNADIREAQQLSITGVPFFVFDRKYAISGAQDVTLFKQTIERAYNEWKKENPSPLFNITEGPGCGPDGCF
ncbi:DsbA family oxidoreductase [Gynurincola endophyticus]|uniref:DsbA family oxidoreductase n=1 Tax=Gynurincola endophyticus TaxID=2479004 RepID=UPI0018F788D9|nr:DsbA family oxidoreductase [Gynurincola endophyticus]